MITKSYSCLGLPVPILVPESRDEYCELAKRTGDPLLEDAIDNGVYRGPLAKARTFIAQQVEEKTGVEREFKMVGEGESQKKVFTEPEGRYVQRALEESEKSIDELGITDFPELTVDPSVQVRQGGSSTPPKSYLKMAKDFASKGQLEGLATALSNKLGRVVEATEEAVAFAIRDNEAIKAKQRTAEYEAFVQSGGNL